MFPAPPRIRIPRQYEDGLLFEKDEVIRLKVSVTGRPLPRATWYHDGEPIPFGGRYEVSNTERSSGLRISEARRQDRGEYQVRATSRLGEDTVSFLVTVTGEEHRSTKLSYCFASRSPLRAWAFYCLLVCCFWGRCWMGLFRHKGSCYATNMFAVFKEIMR
jgi:hypothetical protein